MEGEYSGGFDPIKTCKTLLMATAIVVLALVVFWYMGAFEHMNPYAGTVYGQVPISLFGGKMVIPPSPY